MKKSFPKNLEVHAAALNRNFSGGSKKQKSLVRKSKHSQFICIHCVMIILKIRPENSNSITVDNLPNSHLKFRFHGTSGLRPHTEIVHAILLKEEGYWCRDCGNWILHTMTGHICVDKDHIMVQVWREQRLLAEEAYKSNAGRESEPDCEEAEYEEVEYEEDSSHVGSPRECTDVGGSEAECEEAEYEEVECTGPANEDK